MKHIIRAVALAGALSGCQTTGHKISNLVPGSKPDRIVATLGKPDADTVDGTFEIYTYRHRHSFCSLHRRDYAVIFERGKLVAFGPGSAKRIGPDEVVIVPPSPGFR